MQGIESSNAMTQKFMQKRFIILALLDKNIYIAG